MKQKEGYLLIDNRHVGQGVVEAATLTCAHCQQQLIRNPERVRARAYCPKGDHYICDDCEVERVLTGECKSFKEVLDQYLKSLVNNELINPQSLIAK